jgi:RHS repeat-associated protein
LGSTRFLTNKSGQITDTYNYNAFGKLFRSSGSTVNNYRYTGEQYDLGLDEYYLRQRYYRPSIGRFTRMDTFSGFSTEPLSLNKYLYAHANPVIYTDPSGLFTYGLSTAITMSIALTAIATAANMAMFNLAGAGLKKTLVPDDLVGKGNEEVDRLAAKVVVNAQDLEDLALIAKNIRACNIRMSSEQCDRGKFPVVYWGNEINEIKNHHINAFSDLLPSFLRRISSPWSRDKTSEDDMIIANIRRSTGEDYSNVKRWYNMPIIGNPCAYNPVGKPYAYPPTKQCDEYPYASTLQGGRFNYYRGNVSLALVDAKQNKEHGGKLLHFYITAGISGIPGGMATEKSNWFFVSTTDRYNSYGIDRFGGNFSLLSR